MNRDGKRILWIIQHQILAIITTREHRSTPTQLILMLGKIQVMWFSHKLTGLWQQGKHYKHWLDAQEPEQVKHKIYGTEIKL